MSNNTNRGFFLIDSKNLSNEHKEMVAIIDRLYQRNQAGADKNDLVKIFDELISYTFDFFKATEHFLQSINYSKLNEQKHLHKTLIDQLLGKKQEFLGWDGELTDSFFSFFKVWLFSHIECQNKTENASKDDSTKLTN